MAYKPLAIGAPLIIAGIKFYRGLANFNLPTSVTVGQKLHSTPVSISDIDRRTGLYVLGKSGMGKSWLMVNLMLQDIEHSHGLVSSRQSD